MADDNLGNLNQLSDRAENLAERAQEINQEFSDLRGYLSEINRELRGSETATIEFRDALNSVTRTSSRLSALQSGIEESNKGTAKVYDRLKTTQSDIVKLQQAAAIAQERSERESGETAAHLASQAEHLAAAAREAEYLARAEIAKN